MKFSFHQKIEVTDGWLKGNKGVIVRYSRRFPKVWKFAYLIELYDAEEEYLGLEWVKEENLGDTTQTLSMGFK